MKGILRCDALRSFAPFGSFRKYAGRQGGIVLPVDLESAGVAEDLTSTALNPLLNETCQMAKESGHLAYDGRGDQRSAGWSEDITTEGDL